MIKAIIFDLDGVLVDADKLHFDALNMALELHGASPISWQENLIIYKGIPTKTKLDLLVNRKGLSEILCDKIYETKQKATVELIEKLVFPDWEKIEMMKLFKNKYPLYICSNAIRQTVRLMLKYSALEPFIDFYVSNEDGFKPKPSPDMYLHAIDRAKISPDECLIVEDSDVGYQAAVASGAHVCKVSGPEEVNYYRILKTIQDADRINIVIPAAGQGKRFAEFGYVHPKPLITIKNRPMLDLVLDNFRYIGRNIILMQKQHIDKYCVKDILGNRDFMIDFIPVEGLTEGAACTVLLAKHLINNNNELVIANSDQYLSKSMEVDLFISYMRDFHMDGGIMTFKSDNPKWSYAKCDNSHLVSKVAEKQVISDQATVGIYYFKHGKDFVKYAEQMIAKNIRTNNEFYVCPVFNEFIADGKRVHTFLIDQEIMHGLGTPEDLELFLKNENIL